MNIRSGNPGELNTVTVSSIVQDPKHTLKSISFSFKYVSGYGPAGRKVGASLSLQIAKRCDAVSPIVLYTSPQFTDYPFDVCSTCYSPSVLVNVTNLNISVSSASVLQFVFENNDRNLQVLLPIELTIAWNQ